MLDRLSGKSLQSDDLTVAHGLTGRVLLPPGTVMNGFKLTRQRFLVPDDSEQWSVSDGTTHARGVSPGRALPGELTRKAVIEIARLLSRATVLDATDLSPLLPPVEVTDEADKRVQQAAAAMPSLEAISQYPYSRLRSTAEVLPIGLARGVNAQAAIHLASHSELWGRKTAGGVDPVRLLCHIHDADFAIYENRVVLSAVRSMADALDDSIAAARDEAGYLESVDDMLGRLAGARWSVAQRLYRLFEHAGDLDRYTQVSALADQLEALHARLGAVRDSRLIRDLAKAAPVTDIHWTNLLVDDDRYRDAALLLAGLNSGTDETMQRAIRAQRYVAAFTAYAVLLVIRALDLHDWTPVSDDPLRRGRSYIFERADEGLDLGWDASDVISLRTSRRSIRIIPVAQPLNRVRSADDLELLISDFERTAKGHAADFDHVVVVYPSDSLVDMTHLGETLISRLNSLGTDGHSSTLGVMPIGPLDPSSLERVARLVGWFSRGWTYLDGYPTVLALAPGVADVVRRAAPEAFATAGHSDLAVLRPLTPTELAAVTLASKVHEPRDRSGRRQSAAEADVSAAMELARASLRHLTACPNCSAEADSYTFASRDGGTFWATCRECEQEWGLRRCANCSSRYPVLLNRVGESRGATLDDVYGASAAAVPCAADIHSANFICTNCGECSANAPGCARCTRRSAAGSEPERGGAT